MLQFKNNRNAQIYDNGTDKDSGSDGQVGVESITEQAEAVSILLPLPLANMSELITEF